MEDNIIESMRRELVAYKIDNGKLSSDISLIEKNIETMQKALDLLLTEQTKMKGFIAGVSFVFAGVGALIIHFIDKLWKL